jgi:hypothetical protein
MNLFSGFLGLALMIKKARLTKNMNVMVDNKP